MKCRIQATGSYIWNQLLRTQTKVGHRPRSKVHASRITHHASRLSNLILVLGALLLTTARAEKSAATDAFDAANRLYEKGNYTNAASAYENLLQTGQTSAAVYFNLGNACFKSGQIGRAIENYRLAQRITPRDPDLRANLQFARDQIQGPTQAPTRWQRWLGKLSLDEWTLLAAASMWLWFLLLAAVQWRPAMKNVLRGWLVTLTLATAALCVCLGAACLQRRLAPSAIIIARDVVVHGGPFDESQKAFIAHDGAELQILDQKDDWLQVSADARRIGWVRRAQVLLMPRG